MLDDTEPDLRKRTSKRKQLLDTAFRLFTRHGYHAVGIDWITAEAGVTKATLYRHFKSKDELIVKVLEDYSEQARSEITACVLAASDDPKERILAMFDDLEASFNDDHFYGCQFARAAGEYTDRAHPIFKTAQAYMKWTERFICDLLVDAGVKEASYIAQELNILYHGSIPLAFVKGEPAQAHFAKVAAKRIMDTLDI